ncbi:uncharacterized protein METZ01_LOCUS321890, partial [marine metagenome]
NRGLQADITISGALKADMFRFQLYGQLSKKLS